MATKALVNATGCSAEDRSLLWLAWFNGIWTFAILTV